MDINITNRCIATKETVFDQAVEHPVDIEFKLPDFCPDIMQILKCSVIPKISTKVFDGASLKIEGTVCVNLIYTDEDRKIRSYEYSEEFSHLIPIDTDIAGAVASVCIKQNYMNCRAASERKMEIHGSLSINTKIVKRRCCNVLCEANGPEIEAKKGVCDITNPVSMAEKCIIIEEELEIGAASPSIQSLIRYDAKAEIEDCKLISEKSMVKGNIKIKALYCPEGEETPQSFEASVPFSQIIDLENADELCECEASAEVMTAELKSRTGMSGEARSFNFTAKVLIKVSSFCDNEVPVILDAFSTVYDADVQKNNVVLEKIIGNIGEKYICKKTLEFSEGDIGSVIDLWCETVVRDSRAEGDKLIISGTVIICLIALDIEGQPSFSERSVDFEYKYDLDSTPVSLRCEPKLSVADCSYTIIDTSRLEVRVDLIISAFVYEIKNAKLVTNIDINEEQKKEVSSRAPMTIYYADKGESIWDIAIKFNISPEKLVKLNEITGDILSENKMLIVS